ncbi:MAG: HAD-IA family hydrolase [Chloroflexota bacterium]
MPRYDAVGFDLLTALLDTLPLWQRYAGDGDRGAGWHAANQRLLRGRPYRDFATLVHESAAEVGLGPAQADELLAHWDDTDAWPDTPATLASLGTLPRFIVTNCSKKLGQLAAALAGTFDLVMTAEEAGAYKPDPRPYRAAIGALRLEGKRVLFVAGSGHDVGGATRAGMDVYWANRLGAAAPDDATPLVQAPGFGRLASVLNG